MGPVLHHKFKRQMRCSLLVEVTKRGEAGKSFRCESRPCILCAWLSDGKTKICLSAGTAAQEEAQGRARPLQPINDETLMIPLEDVCTFQHKVRTEQFNSGGIIQFKIWHEVEGIQWGLWVEVTCNKFALCFFIITWRRHKQERCIAWHTEKWKQHTEQKKLIVK